MAGIYQEVHPYQPNVTKSCAKQTFSWPHFFKEMPKLFCILSMKGSVPRICKNIFKKVSQKNRNFRLKIGYNSGYNIKYTWLLKVEYFLNGSTDLNNLNMRQLLTTKLIFQKCTRVYAPFARAHARIFTKINLVVNNYLMS